MSIRIKIKTPDPKSISKKLEKLVNATLLNNIKTDVVSEIKKLIASGQSPVKGFGRFVKYKNKYIYPADLKSASPVNLTLSGKMLSKYSAHQVSTKVIGIGYDDTTTEDLKGQIEGNNEGTGSLAGKALNKKARKRAKNSRSKRTIEERVKGTKGVPARRFIPLSGESFTVSVIRKLKDVYARRIAELFK